MNKRMIKMLSTIALLGGASITEFEAQASGVEVVAAEKSEVVYIPDVNLRREINLYFGQSEDYNPTIAELGTLTELVLHNSNITSLEGLQYATNVTTIYLHNSYNEEYYNRITDLSPLSQLDNLSFLGLNNTNITDTDLRPLKDLDSLSHLHISGTKVKDISILKDIPNLSVLDISNNNIHNIDVLGDLTNLTSLYADNIGLTDVSFLNNLNLRFLSVQGNHILDLAPIMNAHDFDAENQIITLDPIEVKKGDTVIVSNPLLGDFWSGDNFFEGSIIVKNGKYDAEESSMIWENVQDDFLEFEFFQEFGNIRNPSFYTGTVTIPVKFIDNSAQAKVGWVKENGTWYYFNGSGKMATSGIIDGWKITSSGAAYKL